MGAAYPAARDAGMQKNRLQQRAQKKEARPMAGLLGIACAGPKAVAAALCGLDFVRLQALLALHDLEGHLLAFLQRLEAGALDGTEVHEKVRARLRGDEAEALGVVEPLDGSGLTIRHFLTP